MLDDGVPARRLGDEWIAEHPDDVAPTADTFSAVLDDGFIRKHTLEAFYAYLPPDVDSPAPPGPQVLATSGGSARKRPAAYDRSGQTRRQNDAILATFIAAVTSGALE